MDYGVGVGDVGAVGGGLEDVGRDPFDLFGPGGWGWGGGYRGPGWFAGAAGGGWVVRMVV